MKKAMKFLISRCFFGEKSRWFALGGLLLYVAMIVLLMFLNEPCGSEDYLMCKMVLCIGVDILPMVIAIFLCSDITGNRLLRSSPIAKTLFTGAVPIFFTLLIGVMMVVANLSLNIAWKVLGTLTPGQTADTLIITGAFAAFYIICLSLFSVLRYGMVLCTYSLIIPSFSGMIFATNDALAFGFGLTVPAAAAIFCGAILLAMAVSMLICNLAYRKFNFKPYSQTMLINS